MNKDFQNVVNIKLQPFRRPVISMKGTTVLIDTGATIPMFYFPPILLDKAFGGASLIFDNVSVGGIGDGEVKGKIYELKRFELGKLNYENMQVFVPNQIYSIDKDGNRVFQTHPMLLSATMFEGLDYEFDTINKRFVVNAPKDKSLKMDFKIVKTQNNKLVPVVNGVFIQETITYNEQNLLESYRQIDTDDYINEDNLLSYNSLSELLDEELEI